MVGGAAAAIGAAATRAGQPGRVTDAQARLLDKATEAAASGASLSDVKHIVILMQENRSFDHYFGTLSGVRGFSDPDVPRQTVGGTSYPVFDQFGYQPGTGADANGYMQPFNLLNDPPTENGYDTNDIDHSWGGQHASWNHGAMDSFIRSHLNTDGAANGPVITTASGRLAMTGKLNWKTMPEALLEAGVSWKVYNDPTGLLGLSVLPYFKNYGNPFSITGLELVAKGLTPTYPGNFSSDVASGNLPSVSWIIPPLYECEHPAAPPEWGEYLVQQILNTLVSNPEVWAQTVFLVVYDENGGFFDHVPPPTAPAGTAGEYLTGTLPSSAGGIAGPVGLGFRTPCLVISPFGAGGCKYSGVLDHTSTLRFIETRFGVSVPNLTAWRRGAAGDFTGALDLTKPPVTTVPALPATSLVGDTTVVEEAVLNALTGTLDVGIDYPLPTSNSMPSQETIPARPNVP